jgi:hypothetical protein
MDFKDVIERHILKVIEDFDIKNLSLGSCSSSTYEYLMKSNILQMPLWFKPIFVL